MTRRRSIARGRLPGTPASMPTKVAARPLALFEVGLVTEQRFAGLAEAPAALGPALAERLGCEKRVRIPFNPRDRWLTAAREACRTVAEAVQARLADGGRCAGVRGGCTPPAGTPSGALAAGPPPAPRYLHAPGDFHTPATTPSPLPSRPG